MSARLGLYDDIPIEEYHSGPELSNSGLNDFAQSPLHYHALHRNPKRPPAKPQSGQLEGSLAHCMILEPATFHRRYKVGPSVNRNTNAWKAFVESVPDDATAIQGDQAMTALAQAESVRSMHDVQALLATGRPEISAYWTDPDTGLNCRCRPDWVHPVDGKGVILLDVKTCSDAAPEEFARQIARKGYHRQCAFYTDGYERASGESVLGFVFVAVESTWPYAASAVMLDDESIAKGRAHVAAMLPRFAHCNSTDTWPGYAAGVELITLPRWAS